MSVVFVGAGGSGVRALVQLMIELQIPDLVCIDENDSDAMEQFRRHSIPTYIGHQTFSIQEGDVVIYSAATKHTKQVRDAIDFMQNNPLAPAPFLYAEFLGEISKYLFTVAISGTHGKSTTTGLTATGAIATLQQTALAIVGAGVVGRGGKNCWYNNAHKEILQTIMQRILSRKFTDEKIPLKEHVFIVEADEFNHHFLSLSPDISIITSMDHDHVDIYPTRESYLDAFNQFCRNTHGPVFTLQSIADELKEKSNIVVVKPAHFAFTTMIGGHNHSNASLAEAALLQLHKQYTAPIDAVKIKQSVESFQGLHRRAELLGMTAKNVPLYSDYGHHPDEIRSTIQAFQESFPGREIVCFFEAHQARRLLNFWQDFIDAFNGIQCFVAPIFTARESFEEIEAYCNRAEIRAIVTHLNSFQELGETFAKQVGGTYIANRDILTDTIHSLSPGLILAFSAGTMDGKLRNKEKTH